MIKKLPITQTILLLSVLFTGFHLPVSALERSEIARLINEGINYHSNRNYQLAIRSFQKALRLDPENEQIMANLSITHNNYGKYLAERTDGEGAAREFRNALYYNFDNKVARSNLEYKLKELGLDPLDPLKRNLEARREKQKDNYFAAIAELKEANRIQESGDNYLEIGSNYNMLFLHNPEEEFYVTRAILSFEKANELSPNNPKPLIRLGDTHISVGKINQGINFYEQAIKIAPGDAEAQSALINGWLAALRVAPHLATNHVGLATAYQLKGDFLQAERSFRRALQIDSNNQLAQKGLEGLAQDRINTQVRLFLDRAVAYQKEKDYDNALSNYIKALNLEPTNPDIHFNIGTAFQAKGDFTRARKAYSKALELNSSNQDAKLALASVDSQQQEQMVGEAFNKALELQQRNKFAESIAIYERIAQDRPDDDTLFYNLAVAYQGIGDLSKSLANYKKAYAIKKDANYLAAIDTVKVSQANAMLSQAIEMQSKGQNNEAIAKYEEVVVLVPENAGAWYNLGTAYQAVSRDSKALSAYQKAYEIDAPNQSEAMFFAALILEDQRKLIEAIELYDKYIETAPKGDFVSEARDRQDYIKSFL